MNDTFLETLIDWQRADTNREVEITIKREKVTVRCWDQKAACFFYPTAPEEVTEAFMLAKVKTNLEESIQRQMAQLATLNVEAKDAA